MHKKSNYQNFKKLFCFLRNSRKYVVGLRKNTALSNNRGNVCICLNTRTFLICMEIDMYI